MAVSEGDYRKFVARIDAVSAAAKRSMVRMWPRLDHSSIGALTESLMRYMPSLVDKLGKVAALAAAEYYDAARAGVHGDYAAVTAGGSKLAEVSRDIGYIAGAGYTADALADTAQMARLAAFLAGTADRVVKSYSRETLQANAEADGRCLGYYSVPAPGCSCAFCMVKSLQGYRNYMGERLEHRVEQDAWHDNCSCQLVPRFERGADDWSARQVETYRAAYESGVRHAADAHSGGDLTKSLRYQDVLAGMRAASGGAITH